MRILIMGGICSSLINFRGSMIKSMLERGHDVVTCAGEPHPESIDQLASLRVPYFPVHIDRRGTNLLSDWKTYHSFLEVVSHVKPEAVLGYTVKPIVYGLAAAARCRVPHLYAIITGAGATQPSAGLREKALASITRRLYARALQHAEVIFFQNPDDEHLFRKHQIINNVRVVRIPGSGVDMEHYQCDDYVTDPVTFLLIARLLKSKGIQEYASAANTLRNKYGSKVRFLLVGGKETGSGGVPPKVLDDWHRTGTLDYLGHLRDVRPAIRQASVYVLPSYREGTPRTVLEAMAMRRPIITTDAPGCKETVINGTTGFLVPVRDADSLTLAMEKFVTHPEWIIRMGQQSLERARSTYDVRLVNQIILRELHLL